MFAAVLATGCTAHNPTTDGGGDDHADVGASDAVDGAIRCTYDDDCSDRQFCNGAERCMPGAAGADSRGCVPAATPACSASQTCDEAARRCSSGCTDADGDGHDAQSCGGDDCDDNDRNRFPGNTEVCSGDGHDEDCDPCTVAGSEGDADHDTYASDACFNTFAGITPSCDAIQARVVGAMHRVTGSDCDDTNTNVHPSQTETCNGVDDNCDGQIDEGVMNVAFYPDCDGDHFGAIGGTGVMGCAAPTTPPSTCPTGAWATDHTDCDDMHATIHTGVAEVCDAVDNNCDGRIDEDPAASAACVTSSGATLICMSGSCVVSSCASNTRDCDGITSNGCECVGPMHGGPTCSGTTCSFGCNAGYHQCGTTCADNTALATCGSSCVPCPTTGTNVLSPACDGTSCGFNCVSGFGDCNHIASDGCETLLQSDPENCGACGNVCSNAFCVSGTCRPSTGSMTFVTSGTFTVPTGVTRIGVVVVGAGGCGGYGGGGGGALCWQNPITVVPGSTIPVVVGRNPNAFGSNGSDSSFNGTIVAGGGHGGSTRSGGAGGIGTGARCFPGGAGGNAYTSGLYRSGGGGGAGGYSGPGGNGGVALADPCNAGAGAGGAGGGGAGDGSEWAAAGGVRRADGNRGQRCIGLC